MSRLLRIRLVLVLAAVLSLLVVPMAGASHVDNPGQTPMDGVKGWFGPALRWLGDVAGLRRTAPDRRDRSLAQDEKSDGGSTTTGSSCIDPWGHTRPWCE